MEEEIIQPVCRETLKSELTLDKQLRMTNKSNNEIYVVTAQSAPNVMQEIGRLREIAFRSAGGGTGKSVDIDEFDMMEGGCKQLVVWNPEAEEIIGGYRYVFGTDWKTDEQGQPLLATSHMFHFSEKFMRDYAPYTVELGRSFVSLEYQNVRTNTKSIFALDNLWDGLGALTVINPNCKYFFGKRSEEHTSELQSRQYLVCRLLLEKKNNGIEDVVGDAQESADGDRRPFEPATVAGALPALMGLVRELVRDLLHGLDPAPAIAREQV